MQCDEHATIEVVTALKNKKTVDRDADVFNKTTLTRLSAQLHNVWLYEPKP